MSEKATPGSIHILTLDQREYLARIIEAEGRYDPDYVIGAPKPETPMTEPQPAAREYSREEMRRAANSVAIPLVREGMDGLRSAEECNQLIAMLRQLLTERDRLTAALVTLADGYKLKAPLPSPEIQDAIRVARAAGAETKKS